MALLTSLFSSGGAFAQSTGDNLDFSVGPDPNNIYAQFENWEGEYGVWTISGLTENSMNPGFGSDADGAPKIMNGGFDPYVTTLSRVSPYNPYNRSARVGNSDNGAQVNRLKYDLIVTEDNAFFYYDYAVVYQDPPEEFFHPDDERPRFSVSIKNAQGDSIGSPPCGQYEVIAGVNNSSNNFNELPLINPDPSLSTLILWRDWARVGMDLTNYIGQTVTIIFETRDCAQSGHFGYAYVSAGTFSPDVQIDACDGEATIELPLGFEDYNWSSNPSNNTNIETIGSGTTGDVTCGIVSENGCVLDFVVEVSNDFSDVTQVNNLFCTNTLDLSNCFSTDTTASFLWSPNINISSTTDSVVTVQATPDLYDTSQTYNLQTTVGGETYQSTYIVNFNGDLLTAGDDVTLACGASTVLGPCGPMDGATYQWEPSTGLSADNIFNPIVSEVLGNYPSQEYTLTIVHEGTTYVDSVTVNFTESVFEAGPPVSLDCGESQVIGPCAEIPGATYSWVSLGANPALNINDPSLVNPTVSIGATANMETIYELTITLADGTQITDQVPVSFIGNPADAGSVVNAECGPIDLEPCTIINGATYEWSPEEGLSNTLGATTTVTPLLGQSYPTNYQLTVTEADGTVHQSTVVINYTPPASELIELTITPQLEEGYINNCDDHLAQYFTATGGPSDMEYDWEIISTAPETDIYEFMDNNFGGAPADGSEVAIQFYDFEEEFIWLKVTGTSASQPCFYGEGYIKVFYCCFRPGMLKMEGNYDISSIVDSTGVFSSITVGTAGEILVTDQYLLIDGTLHIDQDTDWIDCEVKFEENAKIIVENNISFKVRDSYLSACSDMWDGIYVQDPSSYLLMAQDTVFDAHQAVVSKNGAQLYLENTDFTDNNKSVVIRDFQSSATTQYHPSTIENCKFLVDSMHAPLAGQIPFAGIELENVQKYTFYNTGPLDFFSMATPLSIPNYYIGGSGIQPDRNYFEGLENGINMINTEKSEIRENEFVKCNTGIRVENSTSDIFHSNAFLGFPNGYYQGMRMNNLEDDQVYLSYFRDCQGAIVASNDPNIITNYQVPHLMSGTTTNNYGNYFVGEGSAHRINHMRVQAEGNTIYQGRSRFSNVKRGSKIRYNKIYNISNGNAAIQVQNFMLTPYGNDVDIVGNTIRVDVHGMGIWIRNINSFSTADALEDPTNENHQVAIVENNVTLNGMDDNISYGIRIENCHGIIAGYNNVLNTGFPNTFAQSFNLRGLSLAQTQEALIMANTFTRVGLGIRGIGDLIGSEYDCNIFEQNYHGMYFEGSIISSDPTVFTVISPQGEELDGPFFPATPHNNEWYDAPYSSFRVGGATDNTPFVNWLWKNDDPTIYQHNNIPGMFPTGYPGDIHYCDETAPDEWTADVTYSTLESIASETNTYQNMQDQAQYYDNNFAYRVLRENPGIRNPETASGLVLYNFYELLDNSNFREFYDITQHVKAGELEDALTKNAAVLSDLLIEQNLKQVNTIYINQLINEVDTLTLDERDLLESIAYTTPYLGGDAVYTARAMLDIDPDDLGVAYRQAAPVVDGISKIVIHPNPSSGKLTLTFDTPSDKNCIFECYDIQAKLLKSGMLNAFETTHEVDLSELSAGLYFVRVLQEDEVLLNEKLIMTK